MIIMDLDIFMKTNKRLPTPNCQVIGIVNGQANLYVLGSDNLWYSETIGLDGNVCRILVNEQNVPKIWSYVDLL